MNILYRMFFFVVSMAVLMALTMPLVLIVRFFMRRHRRKYMMWEWRLVYLRSVCPVAMTSLLFVIPNLNHYYHLLLNRLGFTMQGVDGIMFHWSDIFRKHITVTTGFKGCSIIWAAGVVILMLHLVITQRNLGVYFANAKEIGENIFESSVTQLPVQMGIIHKKIYLPRGYQTGETTWLLRHMESRRMEPVRRFLVVLITVIYWFNPVMWLYYYLWNQDNEILGDERVIANKPDMFRLQYAQGILNFRKSDRYRKDENGRYVEKKSPHIFSFFTVYERNPEERARRMMYQKWYTSGNRFSAFFWIILTCFLLFLLSPLHRVWSMSTGISSGNQESTSEEKLFADGKRQVIARANALSPDGLQRVIQLEMRKGKEDKSGDYDGKFSLVMYDNVENKIDSIDMDEVFSKSVLKTYHFTRGLVLGVQDYNGDGIQEVCLGQKQALTEKEFDKLFKGKKSGKKPKLQDCQVVQFSLVNVGNDAWKVLQEGITCVSEKKELKESVSFERIEGVENVFTVSLGEDVQYYQWDEDSSSYEIKNYTQEDIEKLKKDSNTDEKEGEAQDHTLSKEDGTTAVLVSTKRDSTSSEEIQSVALSPRNSPVKFTDIKGYYCDLMWVPVIGEEDSERYALLIYNGTKARTFVIYDTKTKTVYYKQEDGTKGLGELFQQYNEDDISFGENSAVIYSLSQKSNDTLKIEFSAEGEGGVTVKGSYEYNVKEKRGANLSFSRDVNSDAESTAAPTAEPE